MNLSIAMLLIAIMNVVNPPPDHTITACANDQQFEQRQSLVFKTNVAFNDALVLPTMVLSVKAIDIVVTKICFPKSTSVLVVVNLVNGILHQAVYTIIQNWSYYRSVLYYDQPCKVMFNEFECFPLYTINIWSRYQLLFTYLLMAIDSGITMYSKKRSTYVRGVVCVLITWMLSTSATWYTTSDGPNPNNLQANCLSREGRPLDVLTSQLGNYLVVAGAGLLVTVLLVWEIRTCEKLGKPKKFKSSADFADDIIRRNSMGLLITAAIVLTLCAVYSFALFQIIKFADGTNVPFLGNIALWFYTYNYATLALALLIIFHTKGIERVSRVEPIHIPSEPQNNQAVEPQPLPGVIELGIPMELIQNHMMEPMNNEMAQTHHQFEEPMNHGALPGVYELGISMGQIHHQVEEPINHGALPGVYELGIPMVQTQHQVVEPPMNKEAMPVANKPFAVDYVQTQDEHFAGLWKIFEDHRLGQRRETV